MEIFGPECECGERGLSPSEVDAGRCRYCDTDAESKEALRLSGIKLRAARRAAKETPMSEVKQIEALEVWAVVGYNKIHRLRLFDTKRDAANFVKSMCFSKDFNARVIPVTPRSE